jgi:hypothetical protein
VAASPSGAAGSIAAVAGFGAVVGPASTTQSIEGLHCPIFFHSELPVKLGIDAAAQLQSRCSGIDRLNSQLQYAPAAIHLNAMTGGWV